MYYFCTTGKICTRTTSFLLIAVIERIVRRLLCYHPMLPLVRPVLTVTEVQDLEFLEIQSVQILSIDCSVHSVCTAFLPIAISVRTVSTLLQYYPIVPQ